jgi:hypothetical protein
VESGLWCGVGAGMSLVWMRGYCNLVQSVMSTTPCVQVTGCASWDCGAGVCTVGPSGPECDCGGTTMGGPRCDVPANQTAGPAVPGALGVLPCPGPGVRGECSGRGACVRYPEGCLGSRADCVAVCRCGLQHGRRRYERQFWAGVPALDSDAMLSRLRTRRNPSLLAVAGARLDTVEGIAACLTLRRLRGRGCRCRCCSSWTCC